MKRIEFFVDCSDHEADNVKGQIESFLRTTNLHYRLNGVDDIVASGSID